MLRNNIIYNSSFRLRDINFNNINDIYFTINIIVVIAMTFFEIFIVVVFNLEFIIIIVIDVDIVIIVIVIFEKPIFKFIALDFDIKRRLIMNALFDKS